MHSLYIVVVDVHVAVNNRTADCCHANARMHSLGTPVELHGTSYFCLQYKCTELFNVMCLILLPDMKLMWIFCRHVFVNVPKIKFLENPCSEGRAIIDADGQTKRS